MSLHYPSSSPQNYQYVAKLVLSIPPILHSVLVIFIWQFYWGITFTESTHCESTSQWFLVNLYRCTDITTIWFSNIFITPTGLHEPPSFLLPCLFIVSSCSQSEFQETTDLLSISVVLGIFLKVAFYITNFLFSISHLRAHGNSFLLQNFPLRWFFGGGFYL